MVNLKLMAGVARTRYEGKTGVKERRNVLILKAGKAAIISVPGDSSMAIR